MPDLRYPIGPFQLINDSSAARRAECIEQIAAAPARLRAAVGGLTEAQLDTPYRPGGWTVRQVVHHVPDSHMNSYMRFRWALTEDHPAIKPYAEERWAELADAKSAPIELSLRLLESLHARWEILLRSLGEADWRRTLYHPEAGVMSLETMAQLYTWHGRHHIAHITSLREREGWS